MRYAELAVFTHGPYRKQTGFDTQNTILIRDDAKSKAGSCHWWIPLILSAVVDEQVDQELAISQDVMDYEAKPLLNRAKSSSKKLV